MLCSGARGYYCFSETAKRTRWRGCWEVGVKRITFDRERDVGRQRNGRAEDEDGIAQ